MSNSTNQEESNKTASNNSINYLKYMFNVLLKPCTEFKKQEINFSNFKVSGLLTLIVVGVITLINLITTMYTLVRVSSYWSDEVEWVWENLKEINYLKLIGQNLLICAGLIFGLSCIYFFANLIIKKAVKFSKILAVVATSIIPIVLFVSIVSPLVSMIFAELGVIVSVIGVIYGFIMLIALIDATIGLDNNDIKIYYHTACLSIFVILILVASYLTMSMAFSSLGY